MAVSAHTLRQFDLFAGLTDAALASLLPLCQAHEFPKDAIIFHEDDEAQALYLLARGKVSLYLEKKIRVRPYGALRKATIGVLDAGQVLGWSALVRPYRYTFSATCLEPSALIGIDASGLRRLIDRDHSLGYVLIGHVARIAKTRLMETTHTLTYFLLSLVCHELKAPLAAVENYLNLILGGYAGEVTQRQRQILERSCVRLEEMTDLIGGLLDLAYLRPEDIRSEFLPVSLDEVLTWSLEDVRFVADQKGIQLQVEVPRDLPQMIGAPKRLRQLFVNLLKHAINASPEGGAVTLRVQAAGDGAQAEVIDSGPSFSPQDLPHLFEDFYKVAGVQAPPVGLGLPIARRIVEAHGGEIRAESPYPPGGPCGTRFVVFVPRDPRATIGEGSHHDEEFAVHASP